MATRPGVSAVCVDTLYHRLAERAARVCAASGLFDDVLLVTDQPAGVPHRIIPPLRSIAAYSRFVIRDLPALVDGGHVLVFQWDGFVLDPAAWDPAFLDYDYIGAPWADDMMVGNGGFSLRSRRLLDALRIEAQARDYDGAQAEDDWICRTLRPVLEAQYGIRFAPFDLATRFSVEYVRPRGVRSFGFHGIFNIFLLLPEPDIKEVLDLTPASLWEGNNLWRWVVAAAAQRDAALARRVYRYCRRRFPERTGHWPAPFKFEQRIWKACWQARRRSSLTAP